MTNYPRLRRPRTRDGFRLYTKADFTAMIEEAATPEGVRFNLGEMLNFIHEIEYLRERAGLVLCPACIDDESGDWCPRCGYERYTPASCASTRTPVSGAVSSTRG